METTAELEQVFDRLWPLTRSISGAGLRQTLDVLDEVIPLERIEVPSGERVFDWIVPQEWVLNEAYVVAPDGRRILDVNDNNLHLVGYSTGFRGRVSREKLDEHLHSLPDQPEAIPYVTSYYEPRWGFCLSHAVREALPRGEYEVVIDAEHTDGSLTIGESLLKGESENEVLISTYPCHPSLANNELSGPLIAAFLYRRLAALPERRLTYRFVFAPETIGAISYLALRGEHLRDQLVAGYVVTCAGDRGGFTLKRSRRGDSVADRAASQVLSERDAEFRDLDFFPSGSDERQYCSPGFNLPVASVMRSMYGTYPEYHTSLDNKEFISFEAMQETIGVYYDIALALEWNRRYRSLVPYGEPQLGRRDLHPTLGQRRAGGSSSALRWLLNLADGEHDLLAMAQRSGHPLGALNQAAETCVKEGLIEPA